MPYDGMTTGRTANGAEHNEAWATTILGNLRLAEGGRLHDDTLGEATRRRRAPAALEEDQLRDVGLTRAAPRRESAKPIWMP